MSVNVSSPIAQCGTVSVSFVNYNSTDYPLRVEAYALENAAAAWTTVPDGLFDPVAEGEEVQLEVAVKGGDLLLVTVVDHNGLYYQTSGQTVASSGTSSCLSSIYTSGSSALYSSGPTFSTIAIALLAGLASLATLFGISTVVLFRMLRASRRTQHTWGGSGRSNKPEEGSLVEVSESRDSRAAFVPRLHHQQEEDVMRYQDEDALVLGGGGVLGGAGGADPADYHLTPAEAVHWRRASGSSLLQQQPLHSSSLPNLVPRRQSGGGGSPRSVMMSDPFASPTAITSPIYDHPGTSFFDQQQQQRQSASSARHRSSSQYLSEPQQDGGLGAGSGSSRHRSSSQYLPEPQEDGGAGAPTGTNRHRSSSQYLPEPQAVLPYPGTGPRGASGSNVALAVSTPPVASPSSSAPPTPRVLPPAPAPAPPPPPPQREEQHPLGGRRLAEDDDDDDPRDVRNSRRVPSPGWGWSSPSSANETLPAYISIEGDLDDD